MERELNEYLFLEFGMHEEDETAISDTWPFSLRRVAEIGVNVIFEFDDDGQPFFRHKRAMPGFPATERHDCFASETNRRLSLEDPTLRSAWATAVAPHGDAWRGASGTGSNHNTSEAELAAKAGFICFRGEDCFVSC